MKTKKLNLDNFVENQLSRTQKTIIVGGHAIPQTMDEFDEAEPTPATTTTTPISTTVQTTSGAGSPIQNPIDPTNPTPTVNF